MDPSGPGVTRSASDVPAQAIGPGSGDPALAAAGDTRAFERLYREHVPRILGLARRMMGSEEATEIVQDVFVRAWQKLHTFRGEAQFGTWLYRLAINVILARRASHATRRARYIAEDEVLETVPAKPLPMDLGMDFETAIGRLPEGARHIFVLHDVEGYKHEEIASMLKITSGTSKAQLHRARMMLRRTLNK
jgi:RNA polymerase sigma-70 factor (ECF subfamily)